jgi:hypothetical protein
MIDPGREVPLKAGDETVVLYAGNRALRLIERETGTPLTELGPALDRGDVTTLTTVAWALMRQHRPDLSLDDVDGIIDLAGYEALLEAVGEAVRRAFPAANAADGDGGKAGAGRGTGTGPRPARSRAA